MIMTKRLVDWPKIPLGLRLFLLYFALVVVTSYFAISTTISEIKPTVRQVTEETLVDMANLLAVMAADDVAKSDFKQSRFAELIINYGQRNPQAQIWDIGKKSINHRIYITDNKGIVIADSWEKDIGADFSRWNDVYLTLKGEYGARTSKDPYAMDATVMHVAAPIMVDNQIIGSVTVAKANRSVQPFIDRSKRRVLTWLIVLSVLILIIGALITWRINNALYKLEDYADKMGLGEKAEKPEFRVFYEYSKLSDALENLRNQLDGKSYVEQYVQTLTHELKSPLSAIKGANEILEMPLDDEQRVLFTGNIARETDRLQQLIERLLQLAKVEKLPQLEEKQPVNIAQELNYVVNSLSVRAEQKQLKLSVNVEQSLIINGDSFMLRQALFNIIENALDFVILGGELKVEVIKRSEQVCIEVFNEGPHIPQYALPRLTERFYSLPRENGAKSTGLGLNFVEQVAKLHNGELQINNVEQGVQVLLRIPS